MNEKGKAARYRDPAIDVLRCLALTCIVIAHVDTTSKLLFQLRNFDVPLMVFLSAVCFHPSAAYGAYVLKRLKRLVLPAWLFLMVYFPLMRVLAGWQPPASEVFMYFSLLTNQYLWIVRVFFLMAVLAPLLSWAVGRSGRWFWCAFVVGLALNEWLALLSRDYCYQVVVMTLSYALVFAYGVHVSRLRGAAAVSFWAALWVLIYAVFAIWLYVHTGEYRPTQAFKYPPRLYYLSYALGVVSVLWLCRSWLARLVVSLRIAPLVCYVGSHTFWIYLWHVLVLSLMHGRANATVRFFVIYVVAIVLSYVQTRLVTLLCDRYVKSPSLRRDILTVLVG
ncbi:MAG: acyltransferase [Prevotellaceae bacterium]|nr:acyltransferase [Prevotellaceae bacterium]